MLQFKTWDAQYSQDSTLASIFTMWEYKFMYYFFWKQIPEDHIWLHIFKFYCFDSFIFTILENLDKDPNFMHEYCVQENDTITKNACIWNLVRGLNESVEFLKSEFGPNQADWKWGKLHNIEYEHSPFSSTPLRFLFNRYTEAPGSAHSVNVGKWFYTMFEKEKRFHADHVPVLRIGFDFGTNEGYYSLETGNSGNILSDFYFNMNERHIKNEPYPMYVGTDPRLEENAKNHLYLVPWKPKSQDANKKEDL